VYAKAVDASNWMSHVYLMRKATVHYNFKLSVSTQSNHETETGNEIGAETIDNILK